MPTRDDRDDVAHPAEPNELMRADLSGLLDDARDGGLEPAVFLDRLEAIHTRHLGTDAELPGFVRSRHKAYAAYDELTLGRDRHHQIELLAQALGVGPKPEDDATPPAR